MRFFTTIVSVAAAFSALVSAQAVSTKNNAITAPVAGTSITAGKTFNIQWTNVVGASVTLVLETGDSGDLQPVATIVSGAPNSGSYEWTVPATLPAGADYTIMIQYDKNPADYNYSDRFTLISTVTATPSASTATSTATTSSASTSSAASTSTAVMTTSTAITTSTASNSTATTSGSTMSTSTSTKKTSSSSGTSSSPTSSSTGAPPSAANSNLSSPLAVIIAVLAAALFLH